MMLRVYFKIHKLEQGAIYNVKEDISGLFYPSAFLTINRKKSHKKPFKLITKVDIVSFYTTTKRIVHRDAISKALTINFANENRDKHTANLRIREASTAFKNT